MDNLEMKACQVRISEQINGVKTDVILLGVCLIGLLTVEGILLFSISRRLKKSNKQQ